MQSIAREQLSALMKALTPLVSVFLDSSLIDSPFFHQTVHSFIDEAFFHTTAILTAKSSLQYLYCLQRQSAITAREDAF